MWPRLFNRDATVGCVRAISILQYVIVVTILPAHFCAAGDMSWRDLKSNDSFPPTVHAWQTVDEINAFSLLSMTVTRGSEGKWYIPAQHQRYSFGWNRTVARGYLDQPGACNVQFYGLAFEKKLQGYIEGGSAYLHLTYELENGKKMVVGMDTNETRKIHCYFLTSKGFGSEFVDSPKTLGIALSCPITLDTEIGDYHFRQVMVPGHVCRALAEYEVSVDVFLRSSKLDESSMVNGIMRESAATPPLFSKGLLTPTVIRTQRFKEFHRQTGQTPYAVCAVQTFRNPQSGPMLFLFVKYYLAMGWQVIVYDRFGYHKEFLEELLIEAAFHYHAYTIMQLAQPSKYNAVYAAAQGFDMKYFYKMEKNWGYIAKGGKADTADQDQDKTRTYDYCRMEYAYLDIILYIDTDEFFYCPQAGANKLLQKRYQQLLMDRFVNLGVEEMRFVRLPYGGFVNQEQVNQRGINLSNRTFDAELANRTYTCMRETYQTRNITAMFNCWASASSYDDFPKSADFASKCPFHYNHWSCDGLRGGGRDHTANRCRCKVSFDMMNGFEFKPFPERCHLIHLNDNKYRFQSRRGKHTADRGNISEPCPIAITLGATIESNATFSTTITKYHDASTLTGESYHKHRSSFKGRRQQRHEQRASES